MNLHITKSINAKSFYSAQSFVKAMGAIPPRLYVSSEL